MVEIDPITGLPKELGVGESITKEGQRIRIKTVTKTETEIRSQLQMIRKNRLKRLFNSSVYEQIRCYWQSYSS